MGSAASAPGAGERTGDAATWRRACLEPVAGEGPLHESLRTAQVAAERGTGAADLWTAVGQAWIALADLGKEAVGKALPEIGAEGCLEVALAADPGDLAALELEASLLLRQHRFPQALGRAEQVLAKDRTRTFALGIACDALIELGRYEEAAKIADEIGTVRPGPAVYARASFFAWLEGRREDAKSAMRQALVIGRNPKQPQATAWAFAEAARLFLSEGDYGGAEQVAREGLKWAPGYAPAQLVVARALAARQKWDEAIEWADRAAAGGLAEGTWLAGEAYAAKGDAQKSAAAFARFPEQAHDRLLLAQFLAVTGINPVKALTLIEAEAKVRGGVWLEDARAWALFGMGKQAEALVAAKKAIALGTKEPRLLYHAGAIMLAAGGEDAAGGKALIEEALKMSPEFDPREAPAARKLVGI